jgi:hypothetical protein
VRCHVSSGDLFEDFEAGKHGLSRLDLANLRPRSDGPTPSRVCLPAVAEVVRILSERNSCPVSAHIEGVHDAGVGSCNVGPRLGAGWLNVTAVTVDEIPCARQVMGNLEHALILRVGSRPMASRAAPNTVPQAAQSHHQIWP